MRAPLSLNPPSNPVVCGGRRVERLRGGGSRRRRRGRAVNEVPSRVAGVFSDTARSPCRRRSGMIGGGGGRRSDGGGQRADASEGACEVALPGPAGGEVKRPPPRGVGQAAGDLQKAAAEGAGGVGGIA